jgi:proteasome accessory factor C
MLPWLMERGEVPVAEMAAHFQVTESDLVKDLELAAMCGLPPFIDEMIDVFIDEGVVFAGLPRVFTKPLRLTAPEAFSLLAAGRAAMQLPGADPEGALATALRKLAAVLGDDGVVVDEAQPPAMADFADAVQRGARLQVRYWSAIRDEWTERTITPRTIFLDRGHWYVRADDSRSGESRTFRLDRFDSWEPTGEIEPPTSAAEPAAPAEEFFTDADVPTVVLRLRPQGRWAAERYPVREEHEDGDALVVRMVVASEQWLRTLLLRLGANAEVLEPEEWRTLGAEAARTVLQRYEAATGS